MFPKSPNDFLKLSGAQHGEILPVAEIQSSFVRNGHSYSSGTSMFSFILKGIMFSSITFSPLNKGTAVSSWLYAFGRLSNVAI